VHAERDLDGTLLFEVHVAEALAVLRGVIAHEPHVLDLATAGEELTQLVLLHVEWQVAQEDAALVVQRAGH
jgi:hypothetical protein